MVWVILLIGCASSRTGEDIGKRGCHYQTIGGRNLFRHVWIVRQADGRTWVLWRDDNRLWSLGMDGKPIPEEITNGRVRLGSCPDEGGMGASVHP